MKTTINIPNPLYEAAQKLAEQLNVSLSELYTLALSTYVSSYQQEDITVALNQVYEEEPSALEPVILSLQRASIDGEEW